MAEPLTIDRFRDLADAYGGSVARWPEPVRAAALAMAGEPRAAAILTRANALDVTLDAWRTPAPDSALVERILREGPVACADPLRRAKLWWSAIGFAATLTGVAAGSVAAAAVTHQPDATGNMTAFGDLPGGEDGS